ncbi:hypothetical protein H696_04380 [Fonticula alba]|uniref:Phospholipid-transporting ATPase n=1 Tax=Fonticula alba TaxID=691883 RepID=A0A058Z4D8_FONAL|nr:hypothetical protein H696_04380 [Fonticula alba]KCV68961.1 hypothetical protein H696_04380 [Fonticula alba]|eukprot:XP_009496532.1 hypothetical protein H696_04380 [Fonticula alba]
MVRLSRKKIDFEIPPDADSEPVTDYRAFELDAGHLFDDSLPTSAPLSASPASPTARPYVDPTAPLLDSATGMIVSSVGSIQGRDYVTSILPLNNGAGDDSGDIGGDGGPGNDQALTADEQDHLATPTPPPYSVLVNATFPSSSKPPSNYIRTTKYTFLTFLPLNLFSQFKRYYNLYFLFASLLSVALPEASPVSPSLMILPLLMVVIVTMIKDAFEDLMRFSSDRASNSLPVRVRRSGVAATGKRSLSSQHLSPDDDMSEGFQMVASRDVCPGDIVLVKRDETIPADIVILASSNTVEGHCFIQTAQLDGETNLKRRQAALRGETVGKDSTKSDILCSARRDYGRIDCDAPNAHQYHFEGQLDWIVRQQSVGLQMGLGPEHVALRGAVLKNTEAIYGAVVYVGADTKIMRNTIAPQLKHSTMESTINQLVLSIFVLNFIILAYSAASSAIWHKKHGVAAWYLNWTAADTNSTVGVYHLISYFVMWTYLVPISLFVSMEVVRFFQALFMQWDKQMMSPEIGGSGGDMARSSELAGTGANPFDSPPALSASSSQDRLAPKMIPMGANNSNLNEDLGQIQHIFSDKTGTLTQNLMRVYGWSVGARTYVDPINLRDSGLGDATASTAADDQPSDASRDLLSPSAQPRDLLRTAILSGTPFEQAAAQRFVQAVTLCAGVVSSVAEGGSIDMAPPLGLVVGSPPSASRVPPEYAHPLNYDGDSPDELALLSHLQAQEGIRLFTVSEKERVVSSDVFPDGFQRWTLHYTLPFSSARKRMSVVVQDQSTGEYFIFSKGADSVIFGLSAAGQAGVPESSLDTLDYHPRGLALTQGFVDAFASTGLRTLVFGYRLLSADEFQTFSEAHQAAEMIVGSGGADAGLADDGTTPLGGGRAAALTRAYALIERDFLILGSSAVEDRLQDNVAQTIEQLLAADIRFWLLTGDKMATSIAVGVSCGLVQNAPGNGTAPGVAGPADVVRISGARTLADCRLKLVAILDKLTPSTTIVVDGTSLVNILKYPELSAHFLQAANLARSVICCRVSPAQKAEVVDLVRRESGSITLSIGDGANDVSMLQAAHVGVGLRGREGSQAARAADYTLGEFQHLARLVIIHGRYSLMRMGDLVTFSFYKNAAFIIVVFWWGYQSGWSGVSLFNDRVMALYNVFYSSFPPLCQALFDFDVQEGVLLRVPRLYQQPRDEKINFGAVRLGRWMFDGLAQSGLVYLIILGSLNWLDGADLNFGSLSVLASTTVITLVLMRLAIRVRSWTLSIFWAFFFSLVLYYLTICTVSALGFIFGGSVLHLLSSPYAHLVSALAITAALLPAITFGAYRALFMPHDSQLAVESAHVGKVDRLAEESALGRASLSRSFSSTLNLGVSHVDSFGNDGDDDGHAGGAGSGSAYLRSSRWSASVDDAAGGLSSSIAYTQVSNFASQRNSSGNYSSDESRPLLQY